MSWRSSLAGALALAAAAAGASGAAETEQALHARMIEQARRLFVQVGLAPKPYDSSEGIPEQEYYEYDEARFGSELADGSLAKRARRAWRFGALAGRNGEFVVDGLGIDWRHIDSVTAVGPDGVERPARPV